MEGEDAQGHKVGPALAVIELSSIARAFSVTDVLIKQAPSELLIAHTISPGRFLILFHGGVAEVEESYQAGIDRADEAILDTVFLPQPHESLLAMLAGGTGPSKVDALGIVETATCAATVRAADSAAKAAETTLCHLHLGQGIGGKGVFAFTGELHDVQASLEAATWAARDEHLLFVEEIAAPHGAMTLSMLGRASVSPDY